MTCFFDDYRESLYNCTKPYQYVGGEYLSYNKNFDDSSVRVLLTFPDKYEIGISNHGVRILYEQINKAPNYMADRLYAPETDFAVKSLYGLESKRCAAEFDIIGFSLQWELSYPTVLKMLEMSNVPYRNSERNDNHPIIIAGGPCVFNPLPMSDFIDCFIIGDGEDIILEICDVIDKCKNLSRKKKIEKLSQISGVWAKGFNDKVVKRVADLKYDTAPLRYPIPFSSSVQDRAVIEIRRGCGRMCRFCQPGHVTLPIRERSAEEIISIAKKLVSSTGYDEYSLLSLSSNDYSNISEVIKELSKDFNKKKVSVSLPSQRIDGFSLELANLVQTVRKSTMTLAPEAGSQRLRNLIKKNISKEQIIDTVLELYKNGWSKVKFYFISGLPTETIDDMDEMADLLREIRHKTRLLKKNLDLCYGFDITCTLSIFVPKPFTPFQWCGQMGIDKVNEHIKYLKSKTDNIKGVKINYHEMYVSQIEAVLTRGDDGLCKFIEALYKKGCYLDGWGEHFDKNVWNSTADELGISLSELAQKSHNVNEKLPWDFIDIGIDKNWLINEYNLAFKQPDEFNLQPTCEHKCVNCGVCKNLEVKKIKDKKYISDSAVIDKVNKDQPHNRTPHKFRIKVTKKGILKYFSHLDWQNTFLKALSRTNLKVAFTQGFNPTMKVSMGVALPLFIDSECELVDIDLDEDIAEDYLIKELSLSLHSDAQIVSVQKLPNKAKSIDTTVYWAEYKIEFLKSELYKIDEIKYNVNKVCSGDEILITKTNKKGLKKIINIKNSIKSFRFENDCLFIVLRTGQNSDIPTVRADDFIKLIDKNLQCNITRIHFFDEMYKVL